MKKTNNQQQYRFQSFTPTQSQSQKPKQFWLFDPFPFTGKMIALRIYIHIHINSRLLWFVSFFLVYLARLLNLNHKNRMREKSRNSSNRYALITAGLSFASASCPFCTFFLFCIGFDYAACLFYRRRKSKSNTIIAM